MADKQSFLDSISDQMTFDESFFKKIYGYSVYDPGFLNDVAGRLMDLNQVETIKSYNIWLSRYQEERRQELKPVAAQIITENRRRYNEKLRKYHGEGVGENWNKETEDLQQMSDKELLILLQQLKQEGKI